jgi:predicted membrane-bound dolichyl-phosphate-mannose-protein mannosyltransferase
LGRLVAGTFVTLGILLTVVFLHAYTSSAYLVVPAEGLAVLLVGLATASIVGGTSYSWRSYPKHRRVIIFVVAITLATLIAHVYIIGVPSVATSGSVAGSPGRSFSDGRVTVNSDVVGDQLQVTVVASGGNAIAGLNVTRNGAPLPNGGFSSLPGYSSPLVPGHSTAGTWTLSPTENVSRITVAYQYLVCYATDSRSYGCIMDEIFYVPEAMGLLNGQHCSYGSGAPSDCHLEHPFLVPALIASGMALFGPYNVVGWRLMPALLGTFSIPLLFGIAWKLSGSKKIAYLSAVLLSLDVMFFSQSSGALLDVPEVFFGLAAFFAYFAGLRWWKFDRYVVTGVLLGAAGLSKETAVFIVMALLTYILFFAEGSRFNRVYSILKITLVVMIVFAVGLQAYDTTLATPQVPTFVQHVSYILSYGSSLIADKLACSPTTGYWCKYANDPGGPPILPTDWLVYYSPVGWYIVSVSVNPGNISYVGVGYYGVTNLLETWTVYVWVPVVVYVLYSLFRNKQRRLEQFGEGEGAPDLISQETKFAAFALILFLWSYVPYLFLLAAGRVTYPFYFVPAIPAVAMGAAYWLSRPWFPKWLMGFYLVMVFVFFLIYFPDKAFLPVWLRALLGH